MKPMTWNKSRGMTLTELLAVLLIISLLATIAVPVYVARQEDARVRVAQGECREIAMAEETVAAMHGFYVPFTLLDDMAPDPERDNTDEERISVNPFANQLYLINPTIRANDQLNNQLVLAQAQYPGYLVTPKSPLATKLVNDWAGPFITWHRFWYDTSDAANYDGPTDPRYRNDNDMFLDFPLDPWGNPYRFYSPIGVIGDDNDDIASNFDFLDPNPRFGNGFLTTRDQDRFQKYAVVSFGRDGVADTDPILNNPNTLPDNDIYYEFGTDGVGANFGKF